MSESCKTVANKLSSVNLDKWSISVRQYIHGGFTIDCPELQNFFNEAKKRNFTIELRNYPNYTTIFNDFTIEKSKGLFGILGKKAEIRFW